MDEVAIYFGADHILSACGIGTSQTFDAILNGQLGVRKCEDATLSRKPFMAGRIAKEGVSHFEDNTFLEDLLEVSIRKVVADSRIDVQSDEVGLVIATTKGNIASLSEDLSPHERCFIKESMERLARKMGFRHMPVVISNACISGIAALIVARRMMLWEGYRHVVVAGVDVLSEFVVSGFQSFKSVSDQVCRPYDESRCGLSLGEACGTVVLTKDAYRAKPQAVTLQGGALTEDANHLSAPSRTGVELAEAMKLAMAEAGIGTEEIDFVNAHGTATAYNDEMESRAIYEAGLLQKPLNSLKPYLGHTLGASGIVETLLVAEQLRRGVLFGTYGYEHCGVPHPVNVRSKHSYQNLRRALKSGSGFGGCNAAVVLGLDASKQHAHEEQEVQLTNLFEIKGEDNFAEYIREIYKSLQRPNMRFFRMDDLEKLGYVAAEKLMMENPLVEKYGAFRVGILLANHSASLATDIRHQELLNTHPEEGTSPQIFVYTLPNIVAGEISIRHGIKGESLFFVDKEVDESRVEIYARNLIKHKILDAVIVGWCDFLNGKYHVKFNILEKK